MTKREFLAAGFGTGVALLETHAALAQQKLATTPRVVGGGPPERPKVPIRKVKTTKLFKSPGNYPNAIAVASEGLWIGQQKVSGASAVAYHLPEPKDLSEAAWLVDWEGKLLKTVMTPSRNTSGMAYGDDCVWMCANQAPEGVFQVDMNSKLISHHQIPLGPPDNGGGCHGAMWHDGKLWIGALRLRGMLRVDPKTFQPDYFVPSYIAPGFERVHAFAWDNGAIWQVAGNNCTRYSEYQPYLIKYDIATGRVLEMAEFLPGSCDPHGLAMHNGSLISCDAGIHPGWPNMDSPSSGWIFKIDFV